MLTRFFSFILLSGFNIILAFSQSNSEKVVIDTLTSLFNQLPKTELTNVAARSFRERYIFRYDNYSDEILITSLRYKSSSFLRNGERYRSAIPAHYLHPDGIALCYSEDSTKTGLEIFTANNARVIKDNAYYRGMIQMRHLSDRIVIGEWDRSECENKLRSIHKLFVQLACVKSHWDLNDIPDTNCAVILKDRDSARIVFESFTTFGDASYANNHIDKPALFMDSQSERENRIKVSEYVKNKVHHLDIEQGNIAGSIIISRSGKVKDFLPIKCGNIDSFNEIKKILLNMPRWKPGTHKGHNLNVSQILIF